MLSADAAAVVVVNVVMPEVGSLRPPSHGLYPLRRHLVLRSLGGHTPAGLRALVGRRADAAPGHLGDLL